MCFESVMPSNHLTLCHSLLLLPSNFPSIRGFSNHSNQVAKELELQPHHRSLQWIFKIDFLLNWPVWSPWSPRDSQESSPTLQFKSINTLVLSLLYGPTLTSIHDYWKNHSLEYTNLCQQSDVSAFQYAVYVCHSFASKEQVSFNFMAVVTICSDFGAHGKKFCHCFHCFPIYLLWNDGTRCHDLHFLNVDF